MSEHFKTQTYEMHTDGKTWWVQTPAPERKLIASRLTEEAARQLATAPLLLNAAKTLLPTNLGSLNTDDFDEDFVIPVDMTVAEIRFARAAIAKAEGRA